MTRVVEKKHGLRIASDNVWRCVHLARDENGNPLPRRSPLHRSTGDFLATVWAESYEFGDRPLPIKTPAQQLIWEEEEISLIARSWLTTLGERGHRWDAPQADQGEAMVYFKHRRDALMFVRYFEGLLAGIQGIRK